MANDILKKFASELKTERENKGLTLDELHAKTRIDIKFLEAIESGNYSIMPEVYVRAFIREYAAEIGLNPEETLRKFDLAKEGSDFSEEEKSDKPAENKEAEQDISFVDSSVVKHKEDKTPVKKMNMIYLYAIGGIILLAILYFIFVPSSKENIVVERKYAPAEIQKPAKVQKHAKVQKPAEIQKPGKEIKQSTVKQVINEPPFKVELSGSDTVWIRAQIDNAKTEEFTLVPEVSRVITVKDTLKLVIGNAAGVKVNVNDKPVKFTGKKGQVRNLILTRNGLVWK